jgi:PAS domain S-box-containing protein
MRYRLKRQSKNPPLSGDRPDSWLGQRHLEQNGAAPGPLGGGMAWGYALLQGFWQAMQRWLLMDIFTLSWLPGWLRTPMIGYAVAIVLQGTFVTITLLLLQVFPTFAFSGVFEVVVVALIALSWGAGPSLFATLVGALLLQLVVLPPAFGWSLNNGQQVAETLLFVFAGVMISIVASQNQRARRNAEELAVSLAVEQAHLNAIIEAIPDAVALYTSQGMLGRLNHAGQQLAASRGSKAGRSSGQALELLATNTGEPFLPATFPLERVLAGEILETVEGQFSDASGQVRYVSVSAAPLRDQQGRIGGAVSIMRDITALRQNEQALREANRQMSDFLSLASHELRTPLTGIIGHIQLGQRRLHRLASGDAQWSAAHSKGEADRLTQVEEPLRRAEQQTRLMTRLVGDLLDASRIQADRLALRLAVCNLATIIQEAVEEQRLAWPNRSIALSLPETPRALLLADADRIGQVVTNYLTNALKYSLEDQPVEVCLQVKGSQARILVRDHGPGLPASEQERIWERFHRVPGVEVQDGSGVGLGLGLHISRTIIERHHGQVGVESLPGQGSTFWFTLQLARPEEPTLAQSAPYTLSSARL